MGHGPGTGRGLAPRLSLARGALPVGFARLRFVGVDLPCGFAYRFVQQGEASVPLLRLGVLWAVLNGLLGLFCNSRP